MILFEPEVIDYLDKLVYELYKNGYFSYFQTADEYVLKLIDFANSNIENFPARFSPKELQLYGSYYIFYKSNQRTTWYIFFEKSENNYLITYILNNHCEEAKLF